MIPKTCLHCQEGFEAHKETAKFCSASCRVMYNRKKPKGKDAVTPVQMQVLYNAVLDMVGKMGQPEFKGITAAQNGSPAAISHTTQQRLKPPKTMAQYFEGKRDCTCDEDFQEWLAEVDADPYLGAKQKQILKTTNPSNL